jgi:hypothetical protein
MSKKKSTKPSKPKAVKKVTAKAVVLADADNNGKGAKLLTTVAADPAPTLAPLCAVCDHIEDLHTLGTSSHPFTPKPATVVTTPAAKKTKAVKAPKAAKVVDARNGITRPAAETICGKVWAFLDANKGATAKQVIDGIKDINEATARTQTQRYKKFHS